MTREEAIEVMKAYRDKVINSASNQLDGDIEALDMAIKALEDMEWLAKKRPCEFCKYHKTIYEQDGYYSECTRWECQFEAGKGEEEDRR